MKIILQSSIFKWNTWYLENTPSRILIKRGCEANIFNTISGNKGTQGNLQKEVERLLLLGLPERANRPKWGAPSFTKPKTKTNRVSFINDFISTNKQLKHKP